MHKTLLLVHEFYHYWNAEFSPSPHGTGKSRLINSMHMREIFRGTYIWPMVTSYFLTLTASWS